MDKTLLVPVDFSDCTHGLVEQAAVLAGRLGVGVTLLHVVEAPGDTGALRFEDGLSGTELLHRESQAHLQRFSHGLRERGFAYQLMTRPGSPGAAIIAASFEQPPLMIMMGTHGRQGVVRMLLGSVAEYVLRRAEVPVITVRTCHRPECAPRSCAVCTAHHTPVATLLAIEQGG